MTEEFALADIQQASIEYRANFTTPATELMEQSRQSQLIKALHGALSPWHVALENVFWNSTAKNLAEFQLTFNAPSILANVHIGISGVTMNAFNVAWDNAKAKIDFFQAAADSLKKNLGEFQSQLVTLAFHMKPGARPFKDVLAQFVNAKALGAENASMYGVSVYNGDYSYIIDGSAVVVGGIFVKSIRNFAANVRLGEMAPIIRKDEEAVLRHLKLRLE